MKLHFIVGYYTYFCMQPPKMFKYIFGQFTIYLYIAYMVILILSNQQSFTCKVILLSVFVFKFKQLNCSVSAINSNRKTQF